MSNLYIPVVITDDGDGHNYIVPSRYINQFNEDLSNESLVDSGDFENIWGHYMTGGDVNLVQLYVVADNKTYFEDEYFEDGR